MRERWFENEHVSSNDTPLHSAPLPGPSRRPYYSSQPHPYRPHLHHLGLQQLCVIPFHVYHTQVRRKPRLQLQGSLCTGWTDATMPRGPSRLKMPYYPADLAEKRVVGSCPSPPSPVPLLVGQRSPDHNTPIPLSVASLSNVRVTECPQS
jgi:hypothetical protein